MRVPVTRPLRDLLDTVLTGRDPAPAEISGPGWLARLGRLLPALATIAAALLAWAYAAGGAQLHGPLGVAVGIAVAAPLAVAVRWPLLAWRLAWLVAMLVGATGSPRVATWPWHPVEIIVLLVVLLAVGLRHRVGVQVWVGALTMVPVWWFVVPPNRPGASLLFLAPLVLGGLLRSRYAAQRRLAAEAERGVVLTERARIARELHDVVAHHMSLIAVRAETAPYRLGELPEPARDEFGEISAASREALAEMRRLLGVLRDGEPGPTAPQPGLADLPALVAAAREAGADAAVEVDGELAGLPSAVDVSAYRIVQEALANAGRHAPGTTVTVAVRRTREDLLVRVTNGAGPTARERAAGPGHGLRGMRERVSMLDGELVAGPTCDGGFQVEARLPVR
jgi:signal transduction histidine kinase